MNIVGKKIILEYFDQNENYGSYLPRTGIIEKQLSSENVDNWFLMKLDTPFTYEGVNNKKLLIRSRWEGVEISDEKDVSVFIVQIPNQNVIQNNNVEIIQENLVAWGTVNLS